MTRNADAKAIKRAKVATLRGAYQGSQRANIKRALGTLQDRRERAKPPAPVRVIRPGDPDFDYSGGDNL